MKNEETNYKNENTTLDETQLDSTEKQVSNEESAAATKKSPAWKKAATGMGAGILLGSIASFTTTSAAHAATDDNQDESNDDASLGQNPAWADDSVDIATAVSDDMTFSQAFAAARAEVGPGGAFEWHGNVYGTYTAEEWNNMTPEERDEYNNHFSWSQHHGTSNMAEEEVTEETADGTDGSDGTDGTAEGGTEGSAEESIEVVSVDPENVTAEGTSHPADDISVSVVDDTPEVEILGVTHDDESGANFGEMVIDGQEVVLIDVDGEGTFDYMAADLNNDGQITQDEVGDISAANITVQQFDNSMNDTMLASNDGETDYINDDMMA